MSKPVVILGAGLSGLSCALHLGPRIGYGLYEKENAVGGLCRSVKQDGFCFDYTGHLLHLRQDPAAALVRSLLGPNLNSLDRNSWIYSHLTFTRYPFQANTYGLPPRVIRECVLGFIQARIQPREWTDNFYDWVLDNFGPGFGKHFFFGYNEKLWTLPVRQLSSAWVGKYVPRTTVEEVITGALTDQTKRFGYNAAFWYPQHGGIQSLPDALAARIGPVNLGEGALKINARDKAVLFSSGRVEHYQKLVSTMSLKELLDMIEDLPAAVRKAAGLLRYNAVLNINLGVSPALKTDKHWIYFPEKKYPFYRAGFSSNFSARNHPRNTSSLYLEIAGRPGQWSRDTADIDRLVKQSVTQLRQTGILERGSKVITVRNLVIEPAYCIYDRYRETSLKIIAAYLGKTGIYSIGRYGAWEYSAMQDALNWGERTATSIKEELC